MKQQFFVGDVVKIVDMHEPVQGAVWTSTMDDCHGRTGTVVDIVNYTNGYIGYVVNVGFEHYNFAPEWLTIVERAWQKNTGIQPIEDGIEVFVKRPDGTIDRAYAGMFIWYCGIVEWRVADSAFNEGQPEAIHPSHVALGSELVQVGRPHMKIWCDTCQGTGEIDETVGGLPPQYAREDAPCPDCNGKGWWERKGDIDQFGFGAAADEIVADVSAQQEWTDKHYDNNYTLTQKDIERGFVKIDPYRVSKQWRLGSKDESGVLFHILKTVARFGEKNSREREIKALYAQIKCLAEIEGVDLNNQPSEQTK